MHGLPICRVFRARTLPSLRLRAVVCAVVAAGLIWAAPEVAQASSEAIALERVPGIGRTGHNPRPTRAVEFLKRLPGNKRLLATRVGEGLVRKRLAAKRPACLHEAGQGAGQPGETSATEPTKERRDGRHQIEKQGVAGQGVVGIVDDEPMMQELLGKLLPMKMKMILPNSSGCITTVVAPNELKTSEVVRAAVKAAQSGGKKTFACFVIDGLVVEETQDGRVVAEEQGWRDVVRAAKKAEIPCCVLSGTPDLKKEVEDGEHVLFFAKPLLTNEDWRPFVAFIADAVEKWEQPN